MQNRFNRIGPQPNSRSADLVLGSSANASAPKTQFLYQCSAVKRSQEAYLDLLASLLMNKL